MRKVDQAIDLVCVGRLDADAAIALFIRDLLPHQQCASLEWVFDYAGTLDDLREVFRGTVHDGNFEIVDFDERVIDTESTQSSEQVFDSRKHDTSAHQRGRITTMSDGLDCCRNFEAAKVRTAEYITGIGWSGDEADLDRNSSV